MGTLFLLLMAAPMSLTIPQIAAAQATNDAPAAAYQQLLQAERVFSAAAANRTPAEGIAAMFDAEVQLPTRD